MSNSGKPLKKGGYDYRKGNIAGTYNLYKNNKYIKTVGIDGFKKLK